jgi:hypothetical protein
MDKGCPYGPPRRVTRNKATQSFEQVMAMDSNGHPEENMMVIRLRQILFGLARREDNNSVSEAACLLSASCRSRK